jgi:hypothetical protein
MPDRPRRASLDCGVIVEPGARALDLCGLGTRRLQFDRLGGPGIELRRADGLEPNTATGVAALGDFWRGALSPWQGYRASAHDYREIDNERVLVLARQMATGKASGVPISKEGANLFHLRGGKVTKLVLYWDADRALADLSLAPEAGTADRPN